MILENLKHAPDEYAMRLAQGRTLSHRTRDVQFNWFQEDPMSLAEKMKAKAAAKKAGRNLAKNVEKAIHGKKSGKPTKKNGKQKAERVARVTIKDKKGKPVTGRDNTFTCVECGHEITGPWSYKNHLVNVHEYSRKQAGLRDVA